MYHLIDLFCGIGGVSTGFEKAGFNVYAAVDLWEDALKVHEKNHPSALHVNMKLGDEASMIKVKQLITEAMKSGRVHVHASPPCQNLSAINAKRNESRGLDLTFWTLDLLLKLHKEYNISFTMEQVPNKELKKQINERYPNVNSQVFKMCDYGVLQSRSRLILSSSKLLMTKCRPPKLSDIIDVPKETMYIGAPAYSYDKYTKGTSYVRYKKYTPDIIPYTVVSRSSPFVDKNMKVIRDMVLSEEMKLQGFPTNYLDNLKLKVQCKKTMVANSVPVPFSYAMALSLKCDQNA